MTKWWLAMFWRSSRWRRSRLCTYHSRSSGLSCNTEGAWLPIMCVQHIQCDAIHGGLSAVMRALVRAIHTDSYHRGFAVCINGKPTSFAWPNSLTSLQVMMLCQRVTWCSKGSSGLKPCQFCANACSKTAIPPTDGFYTIASWEWDRFVQIHITTSPLWQPRQKETSGRRHTVSTSSPLGCLLIRMPFELYPWVMPAMMWCMVTKHYSNSISSVEISAVLHTVKALGFTVEAVLEVALDSNWHSVYSKRPQPGLLKRLFASKQVGEHVYNGQAKETQMLAFLLAYYLHRFLSGCVTVDKELKCFLALQKCASHLRILGFCYVPEREACQVQTLHRAQLFHQQCYVQAYGKGSVIPKHHHRLHVWNFNLWFGFIQVAGLMKVCVCVCWSLVCSRV